MTAAYKHADGKKIDNRRVLVDVERARTVKGWLPRRLGKSVVDFIIFMDCHFLEKQEMAKFDDLFATILITNGEKKNLSMILSLYKKDYEYHTLMFPFFCYYQLLQTGELLLSEGVIVVIALFS